MHEDEGSWAARTRLAELGDPNVDHTWLWRFNPRHGSTLDADEYVNSVRFRLGCAGPAEPITCAACNSGILDTSAAHASCCALCDAWSQRRLFSHTRSRTTMRPHLRDGGTWPHPWHGLEAPLTSSPRPWATPTPHWTCPSALRTLWRLAPTAPSPGRRPNLNTVAPIWLALLRQNISYSPIVWSAYGRTPPWTR